MQTKITINLPDEDETLASTAVVRQSHTLLYRSLAVHEPTVVFIRRGRKKLRWAGIGGGSGWGGGLGGLADV